MRPFYCVHCGTDMDPNEDRFCRECDGDFCEPRAYTSVSELHDNHPKVTRTKKAFEAGGCKHRPKCLDFPAHKAKLTKTY